MVSRLSDNNSSSVCVLNTTNRGLIVKGVVSSRINWFAFSSGHASEASVEREPWQVCKRMITLLLLSLLCTCTLKTPCVKAEQNRRVVQKYYLLLAESAERKSMHQCIPEVSMLCYR